MLFQNCYYKLKRLTPKKYWLQPRKEKKIKASPLLPNTVWNLSRKMLTFPCINRGLTTQLTASLQRIGWYKNYIYSASAWSFATNGLCFFFVACLISGKMFETRGWGVWFLTEDFGPGKGRKELWLATYILVQLPEVLMKLPEVTVSLPYCYLQVKREDQWMKI